jgi:hypothetical protein
MNSEFHNKTHILQDRIANQLQLLKIHVDWQIDWRSRFFPSVRHKPSLDCVRLNFVCVHYFHVYSLKLDFVDREHVREAGKDAKKMQKWGGDCD